MKIRHCLIFVSTISALNVTLGALIPEAPARYVAPNSSTRRSYTRIPPNKFETAVVLMEVNNDEDRRKGSINNLLNPDESSLEESTTKSAEIDNIGPLVVAGAVIALLGSSFSSKDVLYTALLTLPFVKALNGLNA